MFWKYLWIGFCDEEFLFLFKFLNMEVEYLYVYKNIKISSLFKKCLG